MTLQIDSATLAHRMAVLEEIGVGPLWLRRSLMPDQPLETVAPAAIAPATATRVSAAPAAAGNAAWEDAAPQAGAAPVKTVLTLCANADVHDTARYLFVARASAAQGSEELFDNILLALGLRKEAGAQGDLAGLPAQIAAQQPSVLIAMGASIALELSGNRRETAGADAENASFESLRGRLHRMGDLPLLVTYDAAHLLRNPADKRGAWDDLCLLTGLQAADASDPA
ncbi:hypothetical protein D9O50_15955 [Oxalobacteraceae bacterium CAVE-383]|nr:hypothetical protein D9O50_15955 [Oxalobacteraceae bacterium CAVE-383]